MRLASHVRQSRVASADPHEQAPLSTARPSVPWSMKQCSCDRPRDSPHPSHSFQPALCTRASRSPLPPPRRRLLASCARASPTADHLCYCSSRCVATLAHGFSFPAPSPWHSAHEDEPSHQQLSLSDRNDKIAWTMAECALALPHTPRARPQTSTHPLPLRMEAPSGINSARCPCVVEWDARLTAVDGAQPTR